MKKTTITIALLLTMLIAQDTVEDLENQPVVANLSPSVIDMPLVEEEVAMSQGVTQSRSKSQEHNASNLETVNGVIRKKIKKSDSTTVTELDETAKEVEDIEPAGVTSL